MKSIRNVNLVISNDGLVAKISIAAGERDYPSLDAIQTAVSGAGIVYGVKEELLERLSRERTAVTDMVFAEGKPAVHGEPGSLVWYIELDPAQMHRVRMDGKVDFKDLKTYEAVSKGQELVSKVPPMSGAPGVSVTGEPIYADGEDVELPTGNNTTVSEDGLTLHAVREGYVFWCANKLHVDDVYHIKGDVDFSTGNVNFDGAILIEGDVRSGFRVQTKDTIHVNGNIEAAEVYSQNGDIIVQRGIVGGHRAKILTGGDLHCGFIQDATVRAGRDVLVERYAINSDISAGGVVSLTEMEALIRGGKVFAEQEICAGEIGSERGIRTQVGIAGTESAQVDSEKWNLKKNTDNLSSRRSVLMKRMEFFSLLEQRFIKLSDEKLREKRAIKDELRQIDDELDELRRQSEVILSNNNGRSLSRSIFVKKALHKGVVVTIGHQHYQTEIPLYDVRVFSNEGRICIEKYAGTQRGEHES